MTHLELQQQLRKEIPIADAMKVSVQSVSDKSAVLKAPLAPNTNHKSTAFGGSIHSLAVLSALSLVTYRLRKYKIDYVVIQSSQVEYLKPINSDFSAEAKFAKSDSAEKLVMTLEKKGLARVAVIAEVKADGIVCATLSAKFVASIDA